MAAIDWYYARDNKQMGPVSSAELKNLADAGQLQPDDLVWREGLTEWAPARSVRGLFEEETKPAPVQESPLPAVTAVEEALEETQPTAITKIAPSAHPVDRILHLLRSDFNARFVESASRLARDCGLYGLWFAVAAVATFTVLSPAEENPLGNILSGAMLILLLAALQYVAGKFCDALERLNRTVGGSLASTAIPDSMALLSIVAGLAILFGSIPLAARGATLPIILLGIAGFIDCVLIAFAALNPATLHITIASDEASADDEALGVLMFFAKILVRAAPVVFGTGVLAGTLILGDACYLLSAADSHSSAQFTADIARAILLTSAVLPLAIYLLFILFNLVLSLCRAVIGNKSA